MLPAVMTWYECRDLFLELSEETRVVTTHGINTVALYFVPVAWFLSMEFSNVLSVGRYERADFYMIVTEHMPLPGLTPAFLRQRVKAALAEQGHGLLGRKAIRLLGAEMQESFPNLYVDRDLS